MADIKKGTEARQGVEGFAKKGKVAAFICGAAKMLEEKNKLDLDNAKFEFKYRSKNDDVNAVQGLMGIAVVFGGVVAATSSATFVAPVAVVAGTALLAETLVRGPYKPTLLARLVNAPKDVNNFVKKAMEKGGR